MVLRFGALKLLAFYEEERKDLLNHRLSACASRGEVELEDRRAFWSVCVVCCGGRQIVDVREVCRF